MPVWSFMKRSDRRRSPVAGAAVALVGTAVALFVLAGCGGTPGSKVGVNEVTARTGADGVQTVDIEVHSFYFKPNRIVVEAGKPVELTLKFKSLFAPHNMTCERWSIVTPAAVSSRPSRIAAGMRPASDPGAGSRLTKVTVCNCGFSVEILRIRSR